jgi:hypothetical protein
MLSQNYQFIIFQLFIEMNQVHKVPVLEYSSILGKQFRDALHDDE